MVNRKIVFDLSQHTSAVVGRKTKNPDERPLLVLGGIGVQQKHAIFETTA
jgi:hypothetical protein